MRRREFIAGLSAAAVPATMGWLHVGHAQPSVLPVIGMVNGGSAEGGERYAAAFRLGLSELGFTDGRNVLIEYQWLEGRYGRMPALLGDWVRRRVAVIATPGSATAALAAKAATADIPIVFGVGDDPVGLRLVAGFNRPGGNVTGVNFFANEAVSKRMGLLHELVPRVSRMAMLVNPDESVTTAEAARAQKAAAAMGLSIDVLKASTNSEIEQAFATVVGEGIAAVVVAGSGYFAGRRVQLATLASRHEIATAYASRHFVEVGGLMSYGTDLAQMFYQVGTYAGQIIRGTQPTDLPILQLSNRFEFVINLQTAQALGIDVPAGLLAIADAVSGS